jgi:hypothetical protein
MTADTIVFKCGMGKRFCCEQRWEDFLKISPETCTDKSFITEIKICSLCNTRIHKVKDTNIILIGTQNNLSIAFDLTEYLRLPRIKKPFIEPITADRLKCFSR